jgi:hypothetical protein
MSNIKKIAEFSFQKAAVYQIVVQGEISKKWSNRLGGMQIEIHRPLGEDPLSTLVGQINDQSALSGVLNTLYDLHFTIISVNVLKSK